VTAFVGTTLSGPDEPTRVGSWGEYDELFGGLWTGSELSYAVYQFFLNGGSKAIVARVGKEAEYAGVDLENGVSLKAKSPGAAGNALTATVTLDSAAAADDDSNSKAVKGYTLLVKSGQTEESYHVSIDPALPNSRLDRCLATSQLVKPDTETFDALPDAADDKAFEGGVDGGLTPADVIGDPSVEPHRGLAALADLDGFNLLVIPAQLTAPAEGEQDNRDTQWAPVIDAAVLLCEERRALLLLDPPFAWNSPRNAASGATAGPPVTGLAGRNAAVFFPRVQISDPQGGERLAGPAGTVAGVMARTDARVGVWIAAAGTEDGALVGVRSLEHRLSDDQNGSLNKLGVNCLRALPLYGNVVWGARTCRGADAMGDPWKYIPARRVALFIEESLFIGTKWVVFKPNDEPLWSSIRLNVGTFMDRLFRQGAFQGRTAKEAYFVRCDAGNNPQDNIDRGVVTIDVGFQPLAPAEFVLIRIQQKRDEAVAQGS
jgi:hypothetical protein